MQRWLLQKLEDIGVFQYRWWEGVHLDENSLVAALRQVGQYAFRRLRAENQERKAFDWVKFINIFLLSFCYLIFNASSV